MLTPTEIQLAEELFGPSLDVEQVRFHDNAPIGLITRTYPVRPRTTCQELIQPPATGPTLQGRTAGVTLWNHVHAREAWFLDDYAADYPDQFNIVAAMFFAHELTHVWQWQNRQHTGFTPSRAAWEHTQLADPYLFDPDTEVSFLDYGYEQQGALVEEFVCCATLDPQGARTGRLRALLADALPPDAAGGTRMGSAISMGQLSAVIGRTDIWLPWDGADIDGICNQS
ncbi:hypothetical protein [Aestuariibius sp. HNIBRBA575]|uniref:hypothetical protein n=1 Tax=Aestuariibius sp. HNIBRBA575 TaxID=3233343 RepID=UPI0034A3170A